LARENHDFFSSYSSLEDPDLKTFQKTSFSSPLKHKTAKDCLLFPSETFEISVSLVLITIFQEFCQNQIRFWLLLVSNQNPQTLSQIKFLSPQNHGLIFLFPELLKVFFLVQTMKANFLVSLNYSITITIDDLNGSVGSIADLIPKGLGFGSQISHGFSLM
jgi:hypothetical protein